MVTLLTIASICKLRAIWYIIEVATEENDDVSNAVVNMVWFKGTTIWDYDVKVCSAGAWS